MMDHEQYRRAIDADPGDLSEEVKAHRDSCEACRVYSERVWQWEARLQQALSVTLPQKSADIIALKPPVARGFKYMALAASVLIAAILGVWLAAPQRSLAADVVQHMAGEPDAWRRTDQAVPAPMLDSVLRDAKMRLKF